MGHRTAGVDLVVEQGRTGFVAPAAELYNLVLPLWIVVMVVALTLSARRRRRLAARALMD
jgi:hypothetical protein